MSIRTADIDLSPQEATNNPHFTYVSSAPSAPPNFPRHPLAVSTHTSFLESSSKWEGACIDTGAQKTVCGHNQARAYCDFFSIKLNLMPSNNSFRFGTQLHQSLGLLQIRIPFSSTGMIPILVDVIAADVPFLIGLDALDQFGLYLDTVQGMLVCPSSGWTAATTRKFGHVYIEWGPQHRLLFTKSELTKLHRSFHHPSNDKLLNLLRRARPSQLSADTKKFLEQISLSCDTCQRFGPRPVRFKVTFPPEEDLVFGNELSIDIMFIDGNALLHIVDTATHFSAATFLKKYGQNTDGIWNAFIDIWCSTYTGYPDTIRSDSGSVFTSKRWKQLSEMTGMNIKISGVEAHNSLGLGERLHSPLRRIFFKVQADHPRLHRDLLLRIAIKAMNDTQGENGLVPSLLVFGVLPRFPILGTEFPDQKSRMAALATAQMEMNSIIAERRIVTALTHNVPSAADEVYQPGDDILVYREKPAGWTGPFPIIKKNSKPDS